MRFHGQGLPHGFISAACLLCAICDLNCCVELITNQENTSPNYLFLINIYNYADPLALRPLTKMGRSRHVYFKVRSNFFL